MGAAPRYRVPAARAHSELLIERSRFLCTIDRASSSAMAREVIADVRAQHADATHHCWAFNAGAPGDSAHVGSSDDGEPHGTAGRPMLTVLTHSGVGELVAVVTRYYGGVKLGTGGLARAYAAAVQSTLAVLDTEERVERVTATLRYAYAQHGAILQLLPTVEAVAVHEEFAEAVALQVRLPREQVAALRRGLADATAGGAELLVPDDGSP